MNLENLRQQREQILQVASKYGASNLQVFGSVARQENTTESDLEKLNISAERLPSHTSCAIML